MNEKTIQWPRAKYWTHSFNPVVGCAKESEACQNCYAEAVARRFGMTDGRFTPVRKPSAKMPKTGVVFCGNMTDLFGNWIDDEELEAWVRGMWQRFGNGGRRPAEPCAATYLWLTKRAARMADFVARHGELCANALWGMTAESQLRYDGRIGDFRAAFPSGDCHGWLSAEPLLGPIDLQLGYVASEDIPFSWIVVGCESGPKRRPCKVEWVESVVGQAVARDIPVFVKQLDIDGRCETDIAKFPAHLRIRQMPWEMRCWSRLEMAKWERAAGQAAGK